MPAEVVLQLTGRSRTALDAFKKIKKLEPKQDEIDANRLCLGPEKAGGFMIQRLLVFLMILYAVVGRVRPEICCKVAVIFLACYAVWNVVFYSNDCFPAENAIYSVEGFVCSG